MEDHMLKLRKNLVVGMLAALLAFAGAACNGDDAGTTDPATDPGTTDDTTTDDGLGDDTMEDDGLGDS
jgi:hypothetical protein